MSTTPQKPLLTVQAYVFHINQETKKSWLPVTELAVPVSFYYDINRRMYRIISLDGIKDVVNSGMRSSMTFSRTSPKFGQWTDTKSNTVYGLGFVTEDDAEQFQDQFEDVKEAIRLSKSSPTKPGQRSKSKLTGVGSINSLQYVTGPTKTDLNAPSVNEMRRPPMQGCSSSGFSSPGKSRIVSPRRLPLPQLFTEEFKHEDKARSIIPEPDSQLQLMRDNEKLRIALEQSSSSLASGLKMERPALRAVIAALKQTL